MNTVRDVQNVRLMQRFSVFREEGERELAVIVSLQTVVTISCFCTCTRIMTFSRRALILYSVFFSFTQIPEIYSVTFGTFNSTAKDMI